MFPSVSEDFSLDEAGFFRAAVFSRIQDDMVGNVTCTIRNLALGQEKTTAMVIEGNADKTNLKYLATPQKNTYFNRSVTIWGRKEGTPCNGQGLYLALCLGITAGNQTQISCAMCIFSSLSYLSICL